jgi:hypothetical protein
MDLEYLSNEQDNPVMDSLIRIYESLDELPSDELRQLTIQFGETLCRYDYLIHNSNTSRLATSESTRVIEVLEYLVKSVSSRSSYKLQSLRASLRTWLENPKSSYFTPEGDTLLGITVSEELSSVQNKYCLLSKFLTIDLLITLRKNSE